MTIPIPPKMAIPDFSKPTDGIEGVYQGPRRWAPKSSAERQALGRDQFLHLLVTQLKNQDPQSPLRPDEFAAQLAQFTTVEQLTNLNDAMTAQAAADQLGQLINQTSLSVNLLGREVTARGDRLTVTPTGPGEVPVTVGGSGGLAVLRITDLAGNEVMRKELGTLGAGQQKVTLPSLPNGEYRYQVQVTDSAGGKVDVTTHTVGTVHGVQFRNGSLMRRIGGADVPLDQLVEIKPAG